MAYFQCFKCKKNAFDGDGVTLTCEYKNFLCSSCLCYLASIKINRIECPSCNRQHNLGGFINALNKPVDLLNSTAEPLLGSIFNFQDDFIEACSDNYADSVNINDVDLDKRPWLGDLVHVSSVYPDKLGLLHININSLCAAKSNRMKSILYEFYVVIVVLPVGGMLVFILKSFIL